jgi:peptidoglycan/xylan/chitin deacetylase (PgdA/CDA1 family)
MRLISPLLKHAVYPGLAKAGYLRRRNGAGPAVVTYHGVIPRGYWIIDASLDGSLVAAESLRRQLQLLKDQYNVISPQQFLQWCQSEQELPPRSVLLTCDDGLRNTLTDMLPILQEMGLSCLFFITGASLSKEASMLWYEELYLMFLAVPESLTLEVPELGPPVRAAGEQKRALWASLLKKLSMYDCSRRRGILEQIRQQLGLNEDWNAKYLQDTANHRRFLVLNAGELQSLAAAGMFIGAHTLSHPMLSQSSEDSCWSEIADSRHGLEQALGQPIWALAYPFGDPASVTRRELEMAKRAGYQCAFLNVGGGFGAATPRFAWPRVHVTSEMSLAEFEAHVSGFYRWVRKRLLREELGIAS